MQPYESDGFVPLPEKMQEFCFAILRIPYPTLSRAEAAIRWGNLIKNSVGFTDRHAPDYGTICGDPTKNYADYINGANLQNKPVAWKILGCGGNICKVVSGNVIEALDYTKPLPSDPVDFYHTHPWLFQWATQCYWTVVGKEVIDGMNRTKYKVDRFPQMRPVNVLFPLWGIGGRTRVLNGWRMKPVTNGAIYTPYSLI
jgi:hypothetical protein